MLGGAARVDLLGSKVAPFLARWLHNTIHEKLLKLPDDVQVYPTHGGGSFCSAAAGGGTAPSTIAHERLTNPFAAEAEESSFVRFALTGLGSYPSYYKYMADINRRGPDILGGIDAWRSAGLPIEESNRLDLEGLKQAQDLPAPPLVIDVRQRSEYTQGHIPGALNIELGELQEHLDGLPRELPVVTVCAAGMRATTVRSILQRDGRDNVQVVDEAGTPAWIERGYPSETGEE
ncbi:MAG: hypothetical protein IH963_03805 [Chloroflexi bacterium]|nr:hypothetical protein [Chloroflexota bacterium]